MNATTTKICTSGGSSMAHANTFNAHHHAILLVDVLQKEKIQSFDFNGRVSGIGFGAIHFQGSSLRQVSCYTLLSGCQLPWPPTCCLKKPTPFMGSFSQYFGPLTPRLVHPTAPVLLTKTSPLGTRIHKHTSVKKAYCLTHLEFENGQRIIRPQNP